MCFHASIRDQNGVRRSRSIDRSIDRSIGRSVAHRRSLGFGVHNDVPQCRTPPHRNVLRRSTSINMLFERLGHTARALANAASSSLRAARSPSWSFAALALAANARASTRATSARTITVMVERNEAERAYKRLRRIMINEGVYKDLRAAKEGYRKPSELRVIARKDRERRTYKSALNSKLGWIIRRKERGF